MSIINESCQPDVYTVYMQTRCVHCLYADSVCTLSICGLGVYSSKLCARFWLSSKCPQTAYIVALFRCVLAVIYVTLKSMMTIPTPTVWTPTWYATVADLLCVHSVSVLLQI